MEPLIEAFRLIISGEPEVYFIVWTSFRFSLSSILFAGIPGILCASFLTLYRFPSRRFLISALSSLTAVPTVVVGLFVYSFLSRSAPLGFLGLLFTPTAVIIGQALLAFPIVSTFIISGYSKLDPRFFETLKTLGIGTFRSVLILLNETKYVLTSALLTAFGRVVSEVGASMMLGGNIRWYTRTMTTAIALDTSKGEYENAVSLGILLLGLSLVLNACIHWTVKHEG